MPVSATLCTSIPMGVPRKPSEGIKNRELAPRQMPRNSSTVSVAVSGSPPTKETMAGAAERAKAPRPMVSVMNESPSTGEASAGT